MKQNIVFKRLKKFDTGSLFEIDDSNQSIRYEKSLTFFESYLLLAQDNKTKKILYSNIEYVLVDKLSLLQLQKSEFSNEKYHFSILLVSENEKDEIVVYSSNDYVVLSEIFRLYKIGIETLNSLKQNS
ncbi:hypothetical protein FNH22_31320 [Fulvivirga sp. M361]|uniref:hypothetical protein n=1 Tax=Fulvivirga sp. M361 TaxID=2594266 RepID=UPI00117B0F35|nr:hypothetical protein [Fulvivirga sp. M361]TRX45811.1 hypothetical protein FNH22_31320 [Fulvivirga sp. M361]